MVKRHAARKMQYWLLEIGVPSNPGDMYDSVVSTGASKLCLLRCASDRVLTRLSCSTKIPGLRRAGSLIPATYALVARELALAALQLLEVMKSSNNVSDIV